MIEMGILGDNIVGTCRDSAVDKLVIVFVNVGKKVKVVIRLPIASPWMPCNGFNHIVRHFW